VPIRTIEDNCLPIIFVLLFIISLFVKGNKAKDHELNRLGEALNMQKLNTTTNEYMKVISSELTLIKQKSSNKSSTIGKDSSNSPGCENN
jgi:hypothetical protein